MEQQKSKLVFVPSHHHFDKEGLEIDATPDMLDYNLWPLVNSEMKPIRDELQKAYKDAFNGLTTISPFWAKISMIVDLENKVFKFPHRVWGVIYLGDSTILSISHHTKKDNDAFHSLKEWPEITHYPNSPEYRGEEEELKVFTDWSSRENWEKFFFERIRNRGCSFLEKASKELGEAQAKLCIAQKILGALTK